MKNSKNTIKQLASYFDDELQRKLPIYVLPNGALLYKNFLIKQLPNKNWGIFNTENKDMINQYHMRSCALMAANAYHHRYFNKCSEIKDLDNNYWSNHTDLLISKNYLKSSPDDKYPILLTKLEECDYRASLYKHRISKLFKNTFV